MINSSEWWKRSDRLSKNYTKKLISPDWLEALNFLFDLGAKFLRIEMREFWHRNHFRRSVGETLAKTYKCTKIHFCGCLVVSDLLSESQKNFCYRIKNFLNWIWSVEIYLRWLLLTLLQFWKFPDAAIAASCKWNGMTGSFV